MTGLVNGKERVSAIYTYHSLDDSGSVVSMAPALFRAQMEMLAASGVSVVPLNEIQNHPGAVAITFDDGFANLVDHAVPVLTRLGLPATIFVVSGYCGKRNNWAMQPQGIPLLPLLDWSALRSLPALFSLGAHTVSHPCLTKLTQEKLLEEIKNSRAEIEQRSGQAVESFAYPYGAANKQIATVIRREFRVGCGTMLDFITPESDRAVLPRLDTFYLKSTGRFVNPFSLTNRQYIKIRRYFRELRTR